MGVHTLTNIRFADDVMLLAKTLPQLQHMLTDIIEAAEKRGLELHPDKTKIISNTVRRTGRSAARYVEAKGLRIEVLRREDSIKYLGRKISFHNPHEESPEFFNEILTTFLKKI